MKRLYILISFLCLIGAATAQNSNQNYVVTRTMLNESSSSYLDVVKYYDGLGRLCQTVLLRPIGLWRNMARDRSGVTNR